jgi:trk system potassium uptake protein
MFIGASPASTGGGIKTTTLAVFLAALRSLLRGRTRVEIGNRTLPELAVVRALTVTAGSLVVVGGASFLLLGVDSHDPLRLMFEACSAFGTVGLSAGITASVFPAAKLILIAVMLVGRVGPMTAALTLGEARVRQPITHPEERVLIG